MTKTRNNLTFVNFRCNECGKTFRCGGNTEEHWDRLVDRVREHWGPIHSEILAINPPIGMVYTGLEELPYKGGDVKEWYKELRSAGLGTRRSNGEPLFKTVKV